MSKLWKPPYNYLLLPFSGLYWLGLKGWYLYDSIRRKKKFDAFTIVVGNLTVGGTGKSPLVYLLARLLKREFRVVVISRGYGRKNHDVIMLNSLDNLPDVEDVGDEPFLNFVKLKGEVPFIICKDRLRAYDIAKNRFNPDVVILDDAFQYRKVLPDFSFLVFDKRILTTSHFLLPAGPFREQMKVGRNADVIVFNLKGGDKVEEDLQDLKNIFPEKPHMLMKYKPVGLIAEDRLVSINDVDKNVVGFSGIGDPESFRTTLERVGFNVVRFFRFPDHHWYREEEIEKLRSFGMPLVTTEKDYVKIRKKEGILALMIEPELVEGIEILRDLENMIRGNI